MMHFDVILPRATLAFCEQHINNFPDHLHRIESATGPAQRYPDGSLQLEGNSAFEPLSSLIQKYDLDLERNTYFRSLSRFPERGYELWYTSDYQKMLGQRHLNIVPGAPHPESADEQKLEELIVTVPFRRKPNDRVKTQFAGFLHSWFQSMSSQGLFSEGPVKRASPEVEFWDRVAQFTIDASNSGQNTLNWLTLCLLQFGHDVATVAGMHYDMKECPAMMAHLPNPEGLDYIEAYWTVRRGDSIHVPIAPLTPVAQAGKAKTRAKFELPEGVPADSTPHPRIRSKRFPVLVTAKCHWDDLHITVFFGATVRPEQQKEFRRLIDGWMVLAEYGGLGGTGIDSAGRVEFNQDNEIATLWADMGDVDEKTALTILRAPLEGFDAGLVPITAVLFGKVD